MTEPTARRRGSSESVADQDHVVAEVEPPGDDAGRARRGTRALLARIAGGEIDPSFVITHRLSLEEAPRAQRTFNDKAEDCIKIVLRPQERKDGQM